MRHTLLELVQDLLSEMDSDEVNHISDTAEAEQVAKIIRTCYYQIADELDLPSKGDIIKLEAAATTSLPTRLKIPDAVSRIDWIKYAELDGDEKHYKDVTYKTPAEFINLVTARDPGDNNVTVVTYSAGILLPIVNDKHPSYWTSFDDNYVWFDSWDSGVSTTIVANHTLAFGYTTQEFRIEDTFYPPLPDNLYSYLYAKAKSVCFADIKQSVNPKAEQTENRMRIRSQRNKWRSGRMNIGGPDFGKR